MIIYSMLNPADISINSLPSLPLKLAQSLPMIAALYFCTSEKDLLYIGITRNLNRRWKAHHKVVQLLSYHDVKISWLAITATEMSPALEGQFIEYWKPKLNGSPKLSTLMSLSKQFLDAIALLEDGQSCIKLRTPGKVRLCNELNITNKELEHSLKILIQY